MCFGRFVVIVVNEKVVKEVHFNDSRKVAPMSNGRKRSDSGIVVWVQRVIDDRYAFAFFRLSNMSIALAVCAGAVIATGAITALAPPVGLALVLAIWVLLLE